MFIISGLYTVIVSRGEIPVTLYIATGTLIISATLFIFLMLDVSSRGFHMSKKLLISFKKWPLGKVDAALKKDIRSLQPVKLYVGPFHVVDNRRAPALLRFCLQRTILLVVKSRTA